MFEGEKTLQMGRDFRPHLFITQNMLIFWFVMLCTPLNQIVLLYRFFPKNNFVKNGLTLVLRRGEGVVATPL